MSRRLVPPLGLAGLVLLLACGSGELGPSMEVTVPEGATFQQIVDTLADRELVGSERLFGLYARFRGDDREIRAGRYELRRGQSWDAILSTLTSGRVLTDPVTIPEGFTLDLIARRLGEVTGRDADSLAAALREEGRAAALDVPGPGLEGYLFPDTYHFAPGSGLDAVLKAMADQYRAFWTPERRRTLDRLEMSERQVVTLASIVQAEARKVEEMPVISSVYHNRLRLGYPLQADPTVLYALGGPRERLLYAAMDSVADHPYNTYTHPGLPPGPIGSPGAAALDAALEPADTDYLYFVAYPGGEHIFSRTLAEHNRAVARARRARDSAQAASPSRDDSAP